MGCSRDNLFAFLLFFLKNVSYLCFLFGEKLKNEKGNGT